MRAFTLVKSLAVRLFSASRGAAQRGGLALLCLLAGTTSLAAPHASNPTFEPMRILQLNPCDGGNASFCAPTVLLQGVFQPDSPQKLRAFLRTHRVTRAVFDSPGGNLSAGIEIGQIIRKERLETALEAEYVHWSGGQEEKVEKVVVKQSLCASACAYAFLGGVDRTIDAGARYGVHQFSGGEASDNVSQRLVVELIRYVESMGVSRKLVDLASVVDPDKLRILSEAELVRYDIVTSGAALVPWELQVLDGGVPVAVVTRRGAQEARITLWLASSSPSTFSLWVSVSFDAEYYRRNGPIFPHQFVGSEGGLTVGGSSYDLVPSKQGWEAAKTGFVGQFEVSAEAVERMRHNQAFELDFFFARSMSGYDPSGPYSTANLEKFVPLLRLAPLAKRR